MIILNNNIDEYIFTKKLDDESLNLRFINAIEDMSVPIHSHNAKTPTTDLRETELFDEMSSIVTKFAIESSHEYNDQFEGHRGRRENSFYIDMHLSGTECYMMWGMGYESGEYTDPHNHWPATWVFTYYIDPPKGASGLYFPTMDYELEIENGLLVLVKGEVIHQVKPSEFEGKRYCVGGLLSANPTY